MQLFIECVVCGREEGGGWAMESCEWGYFVCALRVSVGTKYCTCNGKIWGTKHLRGERAP